MKENIVQLCEPCANKMKLVIAPETVYSAWEDTCDVCLEYTEVADIHDYSADKWGLPYPTENENTKAKA